MGGGTDGEPRCRNEADGSERMGEHRGNGGIEK